MAIIVDEDVSLYHTKIKRHLRSRMIQITHATEITVDEVLGMEIFKTLSNFEYLV